MTTDLDNLIVWPDGTTCFADDLKEFSYKSDDYEVVEFGTPEYYQALYEHGYTDTLLTCDE